VVRLRHVSQRLARKLLPELVRRDAHGLGRYVQVAGPTTMSGPVAARSAAVSAREASAGREVLLLANLVDRLLQFVHADAELGGQGSQEALARVLAWRPLRGGHLGRGRGRGGRR